MHAVYQQFLKMFCKAQVNTNSLSIYKSITLDKVSQLTGFSFFKCQSLHSHIDVNYVKCKGVESSKKNTFKLSDVIEPY